MFVAFLLSFLFFISLVTIPVILNWGEDNDMMLVAVVGSAITTTLLGIAVIVDMMRW